MADNGERPEITALRTNLTSITDTVTVGDNLQWFSNCLVEKAFIARRTARAILGGGATPAHKAGQLIDGVFAVILPSDRKSHWFAEFVSIFSTDPAYAELVEKLKRHVVQTNQQQLQSPIPASPSASSSLHVPASSGTTPATSSEESPAPSSTTTSSLPPVPPPPSPNHPSAPSFWTVEKVKSTIQEFRKTFSKLHADVVIEMSNKESENKAILEELRSHLLLLPVRKATLHVKFFDKNEKDIIEAKDARMIMAIPCRYVDYRNNEILLHIVIAFCEEELQKRMKNFCELLEEFEIATTIDVYKKAIPNEVDEEVMNGFSNMIVKIDKPESQYTLHEVRKLNKAIIVKSTLCSHSIYIGAVSRNCVVVRLRFPSSAVGWVLAAITPDFMTTHLLTEVTVDGHQLSLIQAQRYELNNELIIAGRAGQVIRAASLLNSGADIQTKDQVFWTPLKWASRNGHLQVVRLLISREAQLNHQDEFGTSALTTAAWHGHTNVVVELVKVGANLDLQRNDGDSALMLAVKNGHTDVVVELVKAGAKLDLQNKEGDSAVMLAARRGHTSIVVEMVKAGANLDLQKKDGDIQQSHLFLSEPLSPTFGAPSIERDGPFRVSQQFSTLGGSMKSETVFSALASDSRPCTSASASEPLPASCLRNDAPLSPSQPPLPMEDLHKTGAKQKHPTGAAEHNVVLGGFAGIRSPQNLPPPTKRMTVEHFPHEGLRLCPTEFSRQYVAENFEPAGSVGESNHIRALRENQPLIVDNLNLMSILPHLNGNSLLTEAENQEMMLIGLTESEKIMRLVAIIGRKGEDGFHRFLVALEAAEDHPTHKTIAEALESSLIYLLGDCAGIRSPQNLPPPTKRMTVEHFTHEEFSRQYVTEDFEEPAGSVGESNHIRALRENQPFIVDNLNLMSILPHLNVNSLLTEAENQEMQLTALTESEKIMRLVTIIGRKGEGGFHRFLAALEAAADHPTHKTIAEALESSLQNPPRPGTLGSSSPTLLQCFVSNLKGWYKNKHFYQGTSGPYISDIQFIRLALVTKKGVSEAERSKDRFLRATLHGHVEDIVKKKKRLEMEGIFRYGKDPRKLVLVEGAPGVGKTMLAMKLCQLWAQGRALQEYDIVLFVELRQYQKETTLKLETLLETHLEGDQEMMKEVMQHLVRTGGDKVLLILEGWDELSPALRDPFSWFFELIKAKKLPNASIMVTSRPSVTASLCDYMDERRIEVLGFDENQQNEYIQKNIEDPDVSQRVRDHLKQFPNLRALAHIPLTLSIICSVAMKSTSLPITLTELYDKYVCTFLFHNLQKSSSDSLRSLIGLDSLDTIPKEVRQVFEGLCKLALSGFEKKAFIFERCDLEEHCLPCSGEKFDGFGLLTTRTQSATAGRKPLYQFRHLSIQEFLAGLQINSIGDMDRTRLLKEYRSDRQFQNIWKFLSGVSKLRDEAFCQQLVLPTRKGGRDQLFLLHCLYEAQNPDICHRAADKMEHMLHLDNTTLNATDCLCAAYVMGKSEGKWQVNLRGCNIGGDGLEVFKWQLKIHDSQNLKIIRLDLTHNQLDASAMRHVAEMFLELKAKIINVEIASNKIGDEGARLLSKALKEDSSRVKQLHFRDCGFTSGAAKWFSEVLQCSKTLSALHFGFDKLGDRGAEYISAALCQNTVLEELGLYTAGLTGAGLSFLANALKTNRTLSVIRMDRNNFTAPDCHIIAEILLTDNSVERIDLSRNPIGDDGFSIILDALIKKPDALKKLGIFGCEITSREMHKFVEFFKKTTAFTGMNIGLNRLGDTGAGHIVQALRENKSESVKEIYMADTGLSDMGKQLVTEAGAMRKDLIVSCEVNEFLKIGKARIQEKLWSQ